MSEPQTGIVLTDAPPVAKLLKACPQHPKAEVIAANMAGDGICSKCGFGPLELKA